VKTIVIANQKGGVGKTTTAVNLATCLARTGRRVLLVDLDPQANATDHMGQDTPQDETTSSYGLMADKTPDMKAIIRPIGPNLQLAPGHLALAEIDLKLVSVISREQRLARALAQLEGSLDYVVIDCAPSLGISTVNAFCAATHIIVAIQTNWFAYAALKRLMAIVNDVMEESNPGLQVYALATIHRANVNVNKDVLEKIQEDFQSLALDTIIRHTATLVESSAARMPIVDYAHGSRAHQDYDHLTQEIITRIERSANASQAQEVSN
jgi:chromosome partitioning protein